MQTRERRCSGLPRVPRRQKVEAGSEPGFDDREARRARPALRQPVAEQKGVPRFRETAGGGEVHVVEALGKRDPVFVQPQLCRDDGDR